MQLKQWSCVMLFSMVVGITVLKEHTAPILRVDALNLWVPVSCE